LRKAVHFLRQHLGSEIIASRGEEEIGLVPDRCWCDVVVFDEAVEAGRWERATELYQGDLLPGLHLSDVPEFERWLDHMRTRLREWASRAAWSLADSEGANGQVGEAVRWARWAVERSPYDENGIRRLLARLVDAGDRASAVLVYEQFAQRLSEDLDLRPSPDVTALVQTLRGAGPPAAVSHSPAPLEPVLTKALARLPAGVTPPTPRPAAALPRRTRLTRQKAAAVGALAAIGLGAAATLSLTIRPREYEPRGTLLAAGILAQRERLLLADFGTRQVDSSLGGVLTEAFRIDLTQSPAVTLVPPVQVAEVLTRMERPDTARLDPALAREIAVREGIKAVVTGEIARAGTQYVLSAQVVATKDGEVLTAHRVTAPDSTRLIDAVDELSRDLRARVGESLRAIDREPPLAQVTTASLPALRQYSAAVRAGDHEGDSEKAIAHLEEAVALDTGFAMAYRTLGMYASNIGKPERVLRGYGAAMQRLDRLTERERNFTLGDYYTVVKPDLPRAATAYEAILEDYPDDREALNNLGWVYFGLRRLSEAESLCQRALAVDSLYWQPYTTLMMLHVMLKQWGRAQTTYEQAIRRLPNVPPLRELGIRLAERRGDYATARIQAQKLLEHSGADPAWRADAHRHLAIVAAVRGQLREAERHLREAMSARLRAGRTSDYFAEVILSVSLAAGVAGEPSRGVSELERALAQHPLRSLQPMDRPYLDLAIAFARAGRADRARALLAEYEQAGDRRGVTGGLPGRDQGRGMLDLSWGHIALAERRWPAAIARFQAAVAEDATPAFGLPALGRAYDLTGQIDSAIAIYERYLDAPDVWDDFRMGLDRGTLAIELAGIHRRLGELYRRRGERGKARAYSTRFVELWKDCDPELRPQVIHARQMAQGRD
jgi:tetratricopeptide (TPR) repeat protein